MMTAVVDDIKGQIRAADGVTVADQEIWGSGAHQAGEQNFAAAKDVDQGMGVGPASINVLEHGAAGGHADTNANADSGALDVDVVQCAGAIHLNADVGMSVVVVEVAGGAMQATKGGYVDDSGAEAGGSDVEIDPAGEFHVFVRAAVLSAATAPAPCSGARPPRAPPGRWPARPRRR